ncbi:riboflavin kinase [Nocardioides sp. NPDC126508]
MVSRIRGMEKFDSIESLIAAMNRDVDRAREILSEDAERSVG